MYESILNLYDTQKAIKLIKDSFEDKLSKKFNLVRVSAPLFVFADSGVNDYLNGF
jgi:aspartate--ammonia ligase